jgi:hypothetical protein
MTVRQWLQWMSLYQCILSYSTCLLFGFHVLNSYFNFRSIFVSEQIDNCLIFQVGELIGGSQREERYEVIQQRYENFYA